MVAPSPAGSGESPASSSSDSSPEQKPTFVGAGGMRRSSISVSSPGSDSDVPLSRTHQYKKITKPLLERKRRARINKCLDELKEIMTVALQAEGENVSKLEKADILELTVRHLHKLSQTRRLMVRNPLDDLQKFQAGYSSCAQEAATFLLSNPGVDVRLSQRLLTHLSSTAGPAMAAHLTAPVPHPPPPATSQAPTGFPMGGVAGAALTAAVRKVNTVQAPPLPPPQSSSPPQVGLPGASSLTVRNLNPRPPHEIGLVPGLPAALGQPQLQQQEEPVEIKKELPEPPASPVTVTQGSFTVSIRRQTPEPLGERNQNEKSVPIRPAAIRLNPAKSEAMEPVWRPYSTST